MENNEVNYWSLELSSYKLNIQHIKSTKTNLADCLFRLADASLADHDYEAKYQKLDTSS